MVKKTKKKTRLPDAAPGHLAEELESQFQLLQKKLAKARGDFLASHKANVEVSRRQVRALQSDLVAARSRAARAAVKARKTGTAAAKQELKKARAATSTLLRELSEARDVMLTAQSRLHAAKPLDRKQAARAKVLEKFEREWDRKVQEQATAQREQAKQTAARRRLIAKQRAEEKRAAANDAELQRATGKRQAGRPAAASAQRKAKTGNSPRAAGRKKK